MNKKDKMSAISDRYTAPAIALSFRFSTASGAAERHLIVLLLMVATILFGCALSKPPEHEVVIKQALPEGLA